jgi:DNA-binding NtrC family response regulator
MLTLFQNGGSEVKPTSQKAAEEFTFQQIIGQSEALLSQIQVARNFAQEDGAVLIRGETGTGKDLFARAIHNCGNRKNRPFVAVNCATLPPNLAENELFGHSSSAFTGAQRAHKGLVEEADHGTLFLDEIDSLAPEVQPKLLRILEQGETRRLGETVSRRVNVRVICATNKDLLAQVEANRFRSDLYYRLEVFSIDLPPLRERLEDIQSIAKFYLGERVRVRLTTGQPTSDEAMFFTPEVMERLCRYDWPGNVRELKNVIDRAVALSNGGKICVGDLRLRIQGSIPPANYQYKSAKQQFEASYLKKLLMDHNSDIVLAQAASGLSRSSFYDLLRKHKLRQQRSVYNSAPIS